MEFLLRYFIDGNESCESLVWRYTHAARMIIPRIGERVWVDDNTCIEVDMVTYSPNYSDDVKLYLVDVECHDITNIVLAECDEEEDY
nr:MAG TPA: hypothetical protein [Caudoviricetes sp.]